MNALRIAGRVIAGLLAVLTTIVMLTLVSADRLAGSSASVGAAVGKLVDSPDGSQALGAAFVDMALGSDNPDRAKIKASDEQLAAAAATGLQSARTDLVGLAQSAYDALSTGDAATLDAAPVLNQVLASMHSVDKAVPKSVGSDKGKDGGDSPGKIDIAASDQPPLEIVQRVLGMWWLALFIALLLLGAVGWASRTAGLPRWRTSAALFGFSGLLFLVVTAVVPGVVLGQLDEPLQRDLATQVLGIASQQFRLTGGVVLVLGAAFFGGTFVKRAVDDQPPA